MKIKVKKLHTDAVVPKYATSGSSGFDFHALEEVTLEPGQTKLVRTGLAISVGEGYELQVRPRSGVSLKTPLRVANSPGTVDADFTGEICVIISNTSNSQSITSSQTIRKGDRIAQGVVCPVVRAEIEEVENLDETSRGSGGFGSTGV